MARAEIWETEFTPVERYIHYYINMWTQLLEITASDPLPEEVRSGYEACLKLLPRLWEKHLNPRFSSGKQLTLIHGDAYFSNFLVPRQRPGSTYLIDWQSPQVHIWGEDLANLLATFWTRAQRQEGQREEQALRRFYQTLIAHGVSAYSWNELLRDYRLGLIDWLFMPVWDAANGSSRDYWWPKMHCLFQAFQDWECLAFMTT